MAMIRKKDLFPQFDPIDIFSILRFVCFAQKSGLTILFYAS